MRGGSSHFDPREDCVLWQGVEEGFLDERIWQVSARYSLDGTCL